MKMSKFNILLLSLSLSLGATSCNDWLSVQPESEVEDKDLFSAESGFKEALAGVYSSMVKDATYARQLTFGALSVAGQEWDNYPSAEYSDFAEYNYDMASPTSIIAGIWSTAYNSIANANSLLKHLDETDVPFHGDNKAIIKGEALALRAMLHFDLLRCFGVSYQVDPSKPSIPYTTDFTYRVFPQLKVSEVADLILKDLDDAQALLEVDPIYTGRSVSLLDDNGYLINRTIHLNYWAVRALKARVLLWTQRYAEAYAEAKAVYSSDKFSWATQDKLGNGYDNSYADEQIFALQNVNLKTLGDNYFSSSRDAYSFSLNRATLLNRFDNDATDIRFLYGFSEGETSDNIDKRYMKKYVESSGDDSWYQSKMPILRVGEMLLIMAETASHAGDDGLQWLNELRAARNLQPLTDTSASSLIDLITAEYRRELLGEGQIFFLCKRLNLDYVFGSGVEMISSKSYTFPLPQSETEPGQRQENR
ncbi:MAG: RagB/SusD family nutrient uptake outer membrane protein [Bacteroides sp.]|nr:RagB/SusD family nutrient uptake outer membrane protein [Bacteroides sp.]MBD5333222.1 RagB/SusD family nutrient uptake outer membrane protein [Bacteroides sp.]